MAPAMNTRSQSHATRVSNAGAQVVADERNTENDKAKITAAQSTKSQANVEQWLHQTGDNIDSKDDSSTANKSRSTKHSVSHTTKTQTKLTFQVRKSTTKDGKGQEEVRETETDSAIKVTTVTPDRKITRERREIITDTAVITTKTVDAGKKRRRGEVEDTAYVPPGAGEEDIADTVTKRPRRDVRDSLSSYSDPRVHESSSKSARVSPRKPKVAKNDGRKKKLIVTWKIGGLAKLFPHLPNTDSITETEELPLVVPRPVQRLTPIDGWDNKQFKFKFGFTRYPDHQAPTHDEAAAVFDLLRADLASRGVTVGPNERGPNGQGPAHGSAALVTVDAPVRTLLSQATSNENALFVQNLLIKKYTYTVDGNEVQGRYPNYHTIHAGSAADLQPVIRACGLQEKRAKQIKAFLDIVYQANTVDNPDWDGLHSGNAPNAPDFVPGLLSLVFLDNLSKVDLLNWLLAREGVGLKTAHCLMEFSYGMPICAVDTHVHYIAGALGWIPEECKTADNAAMHLDARLPDSLKHHLHQAFWNHRQHCGPCKKAGGEKADRADTAQCVLEDRVKRRDTRAYRRGQSVKTAKVDKNTRKPSESKRFSALSAKKAAETGYVLEEIEWNDDFAAGSVNRKTRKVWKRVTS